MDNTIKVAALISLLTSFAGRPFDEQEVGSILKTIAELRADHVPLGRLLNALQGERKIEAIKEYRTLTGSTLLDAKNAIEANWPFGRIQSASEVA